MNAIPHSAAEIDTPTLCSSVRVRLVSPIIARLAPAITILVALLPCLAMMPFLHTGSNTVQARDHNTVALLPHSSAFTTTTPTSNSRATPTVTPSITPTLSITPTRVSQTPNGTAISPFHYLLPIIHNGPQRYFMPFMRRFGPPPTATPVITPTPLVLQPPTRIPPAGTTPLPTLTPTPTATPSAETTPTLTLTPVTPTGSTTLPPPTSVPEPTLGPTSPCKADELEGLSQATLVDKVKANRGCAEPLVDLLIEAPDSYLDAFYALVPTAEATEDLWFAVDTAMRADNFRFGPSVVDNLWQNLPDAIEQCTARRRCDDWKTYILVPLLAGEMYRCPANLDEIDETALLESTPYGNYFCTEDTATALAQIASQETITTLLTIASESDQGWSRRNGLRVLGRFAELGAENDAGKLVLETARDDVEAMVLERLLNERDFSSLEDLVWITDSHLFPFFDAQPLLERLVIDTTLSELITFRAMAGVTRLLTQKDGLSQRDLDFVLARLNAEEMPFIRAQAARTLIVLQSGQVSGQSQEAQIVAFLEQRLTFEEEFMVLVALQEALDLYKGTNELQALKDEYEADHLAASLTEDPITILSGLAQDELPNFLMRMQNTEAAFYDVLGEPFDTPVEDDPTEAMTLLLFDTRERYREYMDAFVGFGSQFGGLYIEKDATLYTFQRTADESNFTIEHLVQHEFTHYLTGRYVFPNLWTDPGFHEQPKGWLDEGTAEYFGLTVFDEDGAHSQPLADARLDTICRTGSSHTGLSELINRRAGYDQPGVFDYDYAWAFMHYLLENRVPIALRVFDEYRADAYVVEEFASIAGVPSIDSLEEAWHSVMDGWCEERGQLQAAGISTLGAHHDTHESQIMNHRGSIYTLPLPPASATGSFGDDHDVVRLITTE